MSTVTPAIVVLCGGPSTEREVSLVSGQAVAHALQQEYTVELIALQDKALPDHLQPQEVIIFPAMHGAFGEDGELQGLLEERRFVYVGSDARASALCMNKAATKAVVRGATGFQVGKERVFTAADKPQAADIVAEIGEAVVFKPIDSGSSVGLEFATGMRSIATVLSQLAGSDWMVEARVSGREMTIGLLRGEAMGLVEIVPTGGVYDYQHKYTQGATEYRVPAAVSAAVMADIEAWAEQAFKLCGCRDFARVDFILDSEHRAHFLEINTLPGLTPTSLFPKSASDRGYDFHRLLRAMVDPALARFKRHIQL